MKEKDIEAIKHYWDAAFDEKLYIDEDNSSGWSPKFEFKKNKYSTYKNHTHFTPIWMPDRAYTVNTWIIDPWIPDGMLSMNLKDSFTIRGNL